MLQLQCHVAAFLRLMACAGHLETNQVLLQLCTAAPSFVASPYFVYETYSQLLNGKDSGVMKVLLDMEYARMPPVLENLKFDKK